MNIYTLEKFAAKYFLKDVFGAYAAHFSVCAVAMLCP